MFYEIMITMFIYYSIVYRYRYCISVWDIGISDIVLSFGMISFLISILLLAAAAFTSYWIK